MQEMTIHRGEAFPMSIEISIDGSQEKIFKKISMEFGGVKYDWPGALTYEDGFLTLHLTQKMTLALPAGVDVPISLVGVNAAGERHEMDETMIVHILPTKWDEVI